MTRLTAEGSTIPFISAIERYDRKFEDNVTIKAIIVRTNRLLALAERRKPSLAKIEGTRQTDRALKRAVSAENWMSESSISPYKENMG